MFNFRVTINLSNFFCDHRSRARIFINDKIQTISDLKNRVEKIFHIDNFHLTCQNEYLPPLEDVRILQKDDVVWVIPNIGSGTSRYAPKILLSEMFNERAATGSQKRSIASINDYGEEEKSLPKKKKKKKLQPEQVSEDIVLNEGTKKKVKNKKIDVNPPERIKDIPMEPKHVPIKIRGHRNSIEDSPICDSNVIKMNTLLPVLHSHISTYNKKINKTSTSLKAGLEVPSITVTKDNDSDNDSEEVWDFEKDKYSCKGNLALYKKQVSLPTITNKYLQQKKVNIVKIECVAGATQLNKVENSNRSFKIENKAIIKGSDNAQNSMAEDTPCYESVKYTMSSTSVHVQKEPAIIKSKEEFKSMNTELPKFERQGFTITSGIDQMPNNFKPIEATDVIPIKDLSNHNIEESLGSQNKTNVAKDTINESFMSNVASCCTSLNEEASNTVLNTVDDQELPEMEAKAVITDSPNTSTIRHVQKQLPKRTKLSYQPKYFTLDDKPPDYKSSESLSPFPNAIANTESQILSEIYGNKKVECLSDGANQIKDMKPQQSVTDKEKYVKRTPTKIVLNFKDKKDEYLSKDTNPHQFRERNSHIKYMEPQLSETEYEIKMDESLPDNSNHNQIKDTNLENSQVYETSMKYSGQQPQQVTINYDSRIDESVPDGNQIQIQETDLKEEDSQKAEPNVIYLKKLDVTMAKQKLVEPLLQDTRQSQISEINMNETNNQVCERSLEIDQSHSVEATYMDTADMSEQTATGGFIETNTGTIPKLCENEVNLEDSVKTIPATAGAINRFNQDTQACVGMSESSLLSNNQIDSETSDMDITMDVSGNLNNSSIMRRRNSVSPSGRFQRKKQSGIGHLLQELRNTESQMPVETPDIDCTYVTKRQRKRVRKRNKKNDTSINSNTSLGDSSLIVTEPYTPKPMNVKACPSMHIKFEEESSGNIKIIDLAKPNDSKAYPETSIENITIDSDLDESNLGRYKIEEQDILKSPSMSKMLPKIGDFIAFKVLRITDFYTPELSSYITGRVLEFHLDSKQVMFEILSGLDQCKEPQGKLSLAVFADNSRTVNRQRTFAWVDLVGPRLLFP